MKSLKIDESGDIVFNSLGKIDIVEDLELVKQSLNLKLKTEEGELFYNESYGHPKLRGKLTKDSLLSFLNKTFEDDERVAQIEILSFNNAEVGRIKANFSIRLNTDKLINLNIII